ncbi:DUF3703 domain-containing protein [Roseateles sp.]|uniref:DUF3703 domain-containing protein n=1 Tax=Roseateles sp. TaxID=1971397 RepID=UPI0039E7315E
MTSFARRIRLPVSNELDAARFHEALGAPINAFRHLERAHVLGQASTREHVRVHVAMLAWALRQRRAGEVLSQLWRIVAAVLLTPWGAVPPGNTGGSDVPSWKPLPIPADLQRVIDATRA